MLRNRLSYVGVMVASLAAVPFNIANAQTSDTKTSTSSQSASSPEAEGQGEDAMPGPDMMPGFKWREGMMSPRRGVASPLEMHGQTVKIMFAIADTDGDGGLSFDEVTAIHKRIFDSVDADKDGKVTVEEIRTFWH